MTLKIFGLILLVELFDAGSQLLFKAGTNRLAIDQMRGVRDWVPFILRVLGTPVIWTGFLLVACGLVIWLIVLAQADLSLAFPFASVQYLLILAASYFFLGEEIGWARLLGTVCIVLGIACLASS